jgi:hypothetical protein
MLTTNMFPFSVLLLQNLINNVTQELYKDMCAQTVDLCTHNVTLTDNLWEMCLSHGKLVEFLGVCGLLGLQAEGLAKSWYSPFPSVLDYTQRYLSIEV